MTEEQVTVEVPAEEAAEEMAAEPTTENDYAEAGFSPEEIVMAKEQGIIKEPEAESDKKDKTEAKLAEKAEVKEGEEPKDELKHPDGTPYNKNEQGLYWEMKKDRRKRQETEDALRRAQLENKYLNENLNSIKEQQDAVAQELADLKDKSESEYLTDAERAERSKLREKEKELKEQENKIKSENTAKETEAQQAERASRVLLESEKDFRDSHPDVDFDHCASLANDILTSAKDNKIDSFLDDEVKSAYAEKLARKFVDNSVKLSKGEPTDEELPELVFKMAKIHPKYNGAKEPELKGKDIRNGKIVPEKGNIDKMMRNADRRNTAAVSGSGGGRVLVSEEDLTVEDAYRLPKREFDKLSQKTIDRLLRDSCRT